MNAPSGVLAERAREPVRLRAVLLGLALIPLNTYWLAVIELVRHIATPTSVSLFFTAVLTLTAVTLANAALRLVFPRQALRPSELVTVYCLTTIGSAMGGIDLYCCMPAVVAYPFRYAKPENDWADLFLKLLPRELILRDPVALKGFWEGGTSLYRPENWGPWLGPVLRWNAFTLGLGGVWLGMTALFSPRWIETERLTYPISQLPGEIALNPRRLVGSTTFLIGFAIAAGITTLNGFHELNPAVPMIPVKPGASPAFNITRQIADPPWNAVGSLFLSFYPFAIGLSLLLPTKLSLSCWAWYLLLKFEYISINQALSWTSEGVPYTREQSLGAYIAIAAFAAYMGRAHILRMLRDAYRGSQSGLRGDSPLSPRATVLLLAGSFAFVVWFAMRAGMSLGFAIAFCALYSCMSFSYARIRAEMGVPVHEMHLVGPGQVLPRWLGTRIVGNQNVATSAAFYWFNYGQRSHPMPHMAEAMKLASRSGARQRLLAPLTLVAILLGGLTSSWAILHLYYRDGAAGKWGPWYPCEWIAFHPYNELAILMRQPTGPGRPMILASVAGFVVTTLLMQAHTHLSWWPLHPVGYAVANAWAMDNMWFSVCVAWVVKAIVSRYSGAGGISRLTFLAFGLVLGDFMAGGLWALYSTARGIQTYGIWA